VRKLRTVRSENTPVRSLRSASASEIGGKMASPARELSPPQLKGNESLSAQLEAVQLDGVHTRLRTLLKLFSNYQRKSPVT
jgi:hypothetical protein